MLGVHDRPLLATALKPRGEDARRFAQIARDFALGGGDIVKDDHNLTEPNFTDFQRRVAAIQEGVEEANRQSGRCTIYLPHVSGPYEVLCESAQFLADEGVVGVLMSPFLVGLENTRSFLSSFPMLAMAHPAFSGPYLTSATQGWSHGALLGKLFRLLGFDMSIFPNFGGRFSFSREQCMEVAAALRAPLAGLHEALPSPAGGMQLGDLPRMCEDYGRDAVFLIGGALLGHSEDLERSTHEFARAIADLSE